MNNNVDRYIYLFNDLWVDGLRTYFAMYGGDFEEFRKDYGFELNEFLENEEVYRGNDLIQKDKD